MNEPTASCLGGKLNGEQFSRRPHRAQSISARTLYARSLMRRFHSVLVILFFVSAGLSAWPGFALGDPPESDTFKFTWLGVPIGEVTLHYGMYEESEHGAREGPHSATDGSARAPTNTPVVVVGNHSEQLATGVRQDRRAFQYFRLGALKGRTNGLVRWLKRYEGSYQSILTPDGSRYKVTARDRRVPETRDIWFGAKPNDIPKVLDFKDRSSADPLQVRVGVDERSVDPIRLMVLILEAIETDKGCPPSPRAFRVFDGKRRYEAHLIDPHLSDVSGPLKLESRGGVPEPLKDGGRSSAGVRTSNPRAGDRGERVSNSAADPVVDRPEDKLDLTVEEGTNGSADSSMRAGLGASVFSRNAQSTDQNHGTLTEHSVECRLTLVTREVPEGLPIDIPLLEIDSQSESVLEETRVLASVSDGKSQAEVAPSMEVAAESNDTLAVSPQGSAEPSGSALSAEQTLPQRNQSRGTQQSLFWPFNRRQLSVDFSVRLESTGARFDGFVIGAPVGQIKGRLISEE